MSEQPENKLNQETGAETIKEKATDMELAIFLIGHIDNPCQDLAGNNIRDFYIREAKKVLGTMRDFAAKEILEKTIRKYQPE